MSDLLVSAKNAPLLKFQSRSLNEYELPVLVQAVETAVCMSSKFVEIAKLSPLAGTPSNAPSVIVTDVLVALAMYLMRQLPVSAPFFQSKKRPASPLAGASPLANCMTVDVLPVEAVKSLYAPLIVMLVLDAVIVAIIEYASLYQ
jgi:hypothetical protein